MATLSPAWEMLGIASSELRKAKRAENQGHLPVRTVEKIENQEEVTQVRKESGKAQIKATVVGLLVSLIALILPS